MTEAWRRLRLWFGERSDRVWHALDAAMFGPGDSAAR